MEMLCSLLKHKGVPVHVLTEFDISLKQDLARVTRLNTRIEEFCQRLDIPMPLFHLLKNLCVIELTEQNAEVASTQEREHLKRFFKWLLTKMPKPSSAIFKPVSGPASQIPGPSCQESNHSRSIDVTVSVCGVFLYTCLHFQSG